MPAGVFQPHACLKTSLIFKKKRSKPIVLGADLAPEALREGVWFFDMKGDGSSLSAAKKFWPGTQYTRMISQNYLNAGVSDQAVAKPFSWFTTVKEIVENDCILSANTYSPHNGEEGVNHR